MYQKKNVDVYNDTVEEIIKKMCTNVDGTLSKDALLPEMVSHICYYNDGEGVDLIEMLDYYDINGDRLSKFLRQQCEMNISKLDFLINCINYHSMIMTDKIGNVIDSLNVKLIDNWNNKYLNMKQKQRMEDEKWYDIAEQVKEKVVNIYFSQK